MREPLVVSQEVGRLQLEIFTAKNLYSMGGCKAQPVLDKHRAGSRLISPAPLGLCVYLELAG